MQHRPLSGIETHRSLQVLAEGTRIETRSSDKYYRDDQDRTRIERDNNSILIDDPVSGTSARINGNRGQVRPAAFTLASDRIEAEKVKLKAELRDLVTGLNQHAKTGESHTEEKPGFQVINGVSAEGARSTTTIPVGKIGNDRPITIVTERWYSPDLQMLIRSLNTDPRFGETTCEVTSIVQSAPDPSLFKIPSARQ